MLKPIIVVIMAGLLTIIGVVTGWTVNSLHLPQEDIPDTSSVLISITPGMPLSNIATELRNHELITDRQVFIFSAEFLGYAQKIQAGSYFIEPGASNYVLLERLVNSGSSSILITIPEGYTIRQIARVLSQNIFVDSAAFVAAAKDTALLRKYGIDAPSFEGYLFPDSYNLFPKMLPEDIIDTMFKRFQEVFTNSMVRRAVELNMTVNEVVTLASIIQGEMVHASEAPLISSVYNNRLKRKMRLQADPTIQYIIPNGPRRLYNGDLEIDSPYNTYRYRGLPPGPVCNPGAVALNAALTPAQEPFLYMVSIGEGYHAFNSRFSDHLRDKAKLDSLRRVHRQTSRRN